MIYEELMDRVDTVVTDHITNVSTNIVNFLAPIFNSLLILYFALLGYLLWRGTVEIPIKEVIFRVIKIAAIIQLGLVAGNYQGDIVSFLYEWPEEIAAIAALDPVTGLPVEYMTLLDGTMAIGLDLGMKVWDKGSAGMMPNVGLYLVAIFIWGSVMLVTGYAAFLLMLAKVMLAVLLALGPIFIVLLLFERTSKFFESWLWQVVNYGLVVVFAATLLGFLLNLYRNYLLELDNQNISNMATTISMILLSVIAFLALRQIPNIAAAIGGGFQLSTQGMGTALARAGMGRVNQMAQPVQKGVDKGAAWAWDRVKAGGTRTYQHFRNRYQNTVQNR